MVVSWEEVSNRHCELTEEDKPWEKEKVGKVWRKDMLRVLQEAVSWYELELRMMVTEPSSDYCDKDLQEELTLISTLNPESDIKPQFGLWGGYRFVRNKEVYQKYFADELSAISERTGASFL